MVLYPILLSQSWSTTVPNFMLVSGIAQSGQNLALRRLAIRRLTEHHLQLLSLTSGCTGSSASTLVKIPHCLESHVMAQMSSLGFCREACLLCNLYFGFI